MYFIKIIIEFYKYLVTDRAISYIITVFLIISINIFSIEMNNQEKTWLKNNKNRVINIDIYNPNSIYFFQKDDKKLGGVYIDFFKKISAETGLEFNITMNSREKLQILMKNGEGDILFNSTKNPERENYYYISIFNNKYASEEKVQISNYWMSVNKNLPELYSILMKSKNLFKTVDLRESFKKQRPIYYKILLKDDIRLLNLRKNYTNIKVLLPESRDMLPLFYKTSKGYSGYIIDRLNELAFVIGIPLVFTKDFNEKYHIKAIDSSVFLKNNPSTYIPYYKTSIAIFSSSNENFIDSSKETFNQKIGYISTEELKPDIKKYAPKFKKYISYEDSDKALKAILKGEIDYLYGDFKITSMAIGNRYLNNSIKVSGFIGGEDTMGFGIIEDIDLFQIFNIIFPHQLVESSALESELKISKQLNPNYKYLLLTSIILISIIGILGYFLKRTITASNKEKRIARALVHSFEAANELNDEDTGNHILRVNLYSKFLAEKLNSPYKFVKEIGEYASLHDVGKIAISDTILKKPGKLTFEEFEDMKLHVIFGHELILKMELGPIAENIALYHHERWNGSGYYYGLSGTDIPLEARIVALADVYDALRQTRVYKEGFSHEKSVEILKDESGKHFDPKIVNVFLKFSEEFDRIFKEN
ncbi:MAG: HD domain-containing phosphohydrolase [Cetobacterium sp.]